MDGREVNSSVGGFGTAKWYVERRFKLFGYLFQHLMPDLTRINDEGFVFAVDKNLKKSEDRSVITDDGFTRIEIRIECILYAPKPCPAHGSSPMKFDEAASESTVLRRPHRTQQEHLEGKAANTDVRAGGYKGGIEARHSRLQNHLWNKVDACLRSIMA
ncbi:hypothetical protein K440DRAFT_635913 [Wilcoxina mikolae CBS 423.85]|nr:hypothetical protein K440DRAFT_635913 [Wilcoxina mikolae CBS 423.85]